ncbi:MAG: PIG-L family deacetylase [Methylobacter sp.]|nr:PIG-L family deacetylase [Methylobacter sp.]
MNGSKLLSFLSLIMFLFWGGFANSTILVIAPHPDDDLLIAAGVTYAATQRGEQVTIVYMTNGDIGGPTLGSLRQDEAAAGQINNLGTVESDLIFLGYPDGGLATMYQNYPNESDHFLDAPSGQIATYAHRGLGGTDYHNFRFGTHANYNRFNLLTDLKDIINTQRPEHIITVAELDQHPDHLTTSNAVRDAILAVTAANPGYVPVFNKSLVWSTNSSIWPNLADPQSYFSEPPGLMGTGFAWSDRESLDVPLAMQVVGITNLKASAIDAHVSQGGTDNDFLGSFVHKDEFFWPTSLNGGNPPPRVDAGVDQTVTQGSTVLLSGSASNDPNNATLAYQWRQIVGPPVILANAATANPSFTAPTGSIIDTTLVFELIVDDGILDTLPDHVSVRVLSSSPLPNIAPLATVTASSQNTGTNQQAVKAVDGVADGYPGDHTREWATVGERAGAWIQLNWSSSYEVARVVLYDRPNLNDHIISATLTFSSGASMTVGALDNAGAGIEFNIDPVMTSSLRVTVLTVSGSTANIGLSELEVYGAPPTGGNLAPVANAGPDQTLGQGVLANLNGNGSFDPNGDSLSYQWTQTAGPSVSLSGANTAAPSFTTPQGLMATTRLTFALVVNDGQLNSVPDSVDVTVTATSGSGTNIAPLATVTASSQNFETNQQAVKAVDNISDGYPGDYMREWATVGERAGAWIQLNWSSAYEITRVVLHDRPNLNDHITSATLTFSSGASITVGALDNAGAGIEFNVGPFMANSLRVTVVTVSGSTANIGLSELEVYGTLPTGGNLAPVASAGPDQTAGQGVLVNLNGNGSSDPNGDSLSYQWTQTAGPSVSLSGANTAAPSFTTPQGLTVTTRLTFTLVVNDGQLNSVPDSVDVTVTAPSGSGTNIAPLATVTASSQNISTNQQAIKAVDGVVDGYPGDYTREWATINGLAGSWIQLNWSTAYQVNQVILYDRPNLNDQITSATLTFSDGSTVTVGALSNAGTEVAINFASVVTTSVRVTVTTVSGTTVNIGLSEMEVYGVLFGG